MANAVASEESEFADFLVDIGHATYAVDEEQGLFKIRMPDELSLPDTKLSDLCDFVFEGLNANTSPSWLADRAIITTTNKAVQEVTTFMRRFSRRVASVQKHRLCGQ